MKRLKTILKYLAIFLGVIIALLVIAYFVYNEPLPKGERGPAADALANKMLKAVNKAAWDTTDVVQWSFRGEHDYIWDKQRHFTQVKWENKEILVNLNTVEGIAKVSGKVVEGEEGKTLVRKAWEFWCNDSFWFNAVVKAFDGGTERSIVRMEDGSEGLMITYKGGGVTPGDSYLWILDENGLPKSYKMWVKIIPIGGLEFTWEDWVDLPTGAKVASMHKSRLLEIPITNIKGATDLKTFGLAEDIFKDLDK